MMRRFGLFAALVAGSLCFLCASAGAGAKKGQEGKPMNEKREDVKASLAAFAPVMPAVAPATHRQEWPPSLYSARRPPASGTTISVTMPLVRR